MRSETRAGLFGALAIISVALAGGVSGAQPANAQMAQQSEVASNEVTAALADLDFVIETLTRDYAGFPDKTKGDAKTEFESQIALARSRIKTRPDARIHAVDALIDWFADQHLSINSQIVSPDDPYPGGYPEPRAAALRNLGDDFAFTRLSPDTVMLRVPDFDLGNADEFHALLKQHHEVITSTPNLLIDMRFNGGGSDSTYEPLMAYLYTRPIYSVGVEIRRSEANLAALEGYVANEAIPQDTRDFVSRILTRAAASDDDWVGFTDDGVSITTFPKVYDFPRRVGVLAEGAGSSGDQFALDARFSRKVTLLGGPTAGVIDYSNVHGLTAPSGDFVLGYPMTRSLRLPEEPVDNVGVPADVPFDDDVEDHIKAAQQWLERQAD